MKSNEVDCVLTHMSVVIANGAAAATADFDVILKSKMMNSLLHYEMNHSKRSQV